MSTITKHNNIERYNSGTAEGTRQNTETADRRNVIGAM